MLDQQKWHVLRCYHNVWYDIEIFDSESMAHAYISQKVGQSNADLYKVKKANKEKQ